MAGHYKDLYFEAGIPFHLRGARWSSDPATGSDNEEDLYSEARE